MAVCSNWKWLWFPLSLHFSIGNIPRPRMWVVSGLVMFHIYHRSTILPVLISFLCTLMVTALMECVLHLLVQASRGVCQHPNHFCRMPRVRKLTFLPVLRTLWGDRTIPPTATLAVVVTYIYRNKSVSPQFFHLLWSRWGCLERTFFTCLVMAVGANYGGWPGSQIVGFSQACSGLLQMQSYFRHSENMDVSYVHNY